MMLFFFPDNIRLNRSEDMEEMRGLPAKDLQIVGLTYFDTMQISDWKSEELSGVTA
jgi:hypothetical protein